MSTSSSDEHLYIVTYDIADPRRWRVVFKLMHGFGEWVQLSVFQCRLTRVRRAELAQALETALNKTDDRAIIIDVGPAEGVQPRVHSIGKRGFDPIERVPIVV